MLMMRPLLASRMWMEAARMVLNAPLRWTAMTASHSGRPPPTLLPPRTAAAPPCRAAARLTVRAVVRLPASLHLPPHPRRRPPPGACPDDRGAKVVPDHLAPNRKSTRRNSTH